MGIAFVKIKKEQNIKQISIIIIQYLQTTVIILYEKQIIIIIIQQMKMQRWQQKARQKAHTYMIVQAKPTINSYSKSRQKAPLNLSQAKVKNTLHPNLPFSQVIKLLQLGKYQHLLNEYGFPHRIKQKQSLNYIEQMIAKVQEEDQDKFLSLMNALLSISNQLKMRFKRTPIIRRTNHKLYPPPINTNSSNLKKCASISNKKYERSPPINFMVKNCTHSKQNNQIHQLSVYQTPVTKISSKISQKTIKKKFAYSSKDDFSIIHEFKSKNKCKPVLIQNSNTFIKRISQKLKKYTITLQQNQSSSQQQQDAKLYYSKIKEMYLSFDNATMTSNIANIDIEQIIDCLAIQIEQRLSLQEIDEGLKISKSKIKQDHNTKQKKQINKLLKQSLIFPVETNPEKIQPETALKMQQNLQQAISIGSESITNSASQQQDSDEGMFNYEIQSFATDLTCFNSRYQDSHANVDKKDIKNFIQLVVMAGKMEKEAPIIGFVYLLRIMHASKTYRLCLTNWKNLVLITLIQASKIWDDQSLQNHSFSKVISPYTTLEINRLQRHLLAFLNYKLKIDAKQYCQSYFILRKHAIKAGKTANLMNLSLETIKKLQSGVKKCQGNTKKMYKKKLNESF